MDRSGRLAQFAAKYRLPFVLLSDRDGAIAARYGSFINLGLLKWARRNTFLIDAQGIIAKVYLNVQAAQNAAEVISGLKELNRA